MHFAPGLERGVGKNFVSSWDKATFRYLSHSAVVIPCESDPPVPNGKKRGGRERPPPPPKWGRHVTPDSGAVGHASIRPHAGRSRPYLSLLEGSEQPTGGGAERRETDL